jgi:multidrug efflux pump subunit AcrA (membrane-fusion protein)
MFEALIGNKDFMLRAGLFAEASVVTDPDAQALIVPESAITEFAGATKAWVVVDGVTAEREVRIGSRRDAYLEVVQGLSPGDVILQDAEQGRIANVEIADSSPTDVSSVATPVSVK